MILNGLNRRAGELFVTVSHSTLRPRTTEMEGGSILPGESIRPHMTSTTAQELAERLYGLRVKSVRELGSFVDRSYLLMVETECDNPHLKEASADGYVLKVLNSGDSKKTRVEGEHQIQALLRNEGFNVPVPVLNVHGKDYSREEIHSDASPVEVPHKVHVVRLFTYIPGIPLEDMPHSASLLYEVGQYIAHFDMIAKDYNVPSVMGTGIADLKNVAEMRSFLYATTDESRLKLADEVLTAFNETVVPVVDRLPQGLIHGDCHAGNIVMKERPNRGDKKQDDYCINTIIDFGDMTYSCYVFELAICIAHFMKDANAADILESGGHIIAGYLTEMELSDLEWQVLWECVAARLVLILVLGPCVALQEPGNCDFITSVSNIWAALQVFWSTPKDDLLKLWKDIVFRK